MKKYVFIALLFLSQINHASTWYTSLEEAQNVALTTNKLILVDFTAKWCGPCKQMDLSTWNDFHVQTILEDFVPLKIDVDVNQSIAVKYQVRRLPMMVLIDANGKIIHQFTGYQTPSDLKKELVQFSLSTEYLSTELISFYKTQKYNQAIRLAQKYYTYSLLVEKNIKGRMVRVAGEYLKDAKDVLKRKDEDYFQQKQKLELLNLYELAYGFDFEKLNKKIAEIKPDNLNQLNEYQYWFLKYLATKGNKQDVTEMESFLKNKDLSNVIDNGNQVYAFYKKSITKS